MRQSSVYLLIDHCLNANSTGQRVPLHLIHAQLQLPPYLQK